MPRTVILRLNDCLIGSSLQHESLSVAIGLSRNAVEGRQTILDVSKGRDLFDCADGEYKGLNLVDSLREIVKE